jgi:hypothetical protein
MDMMREVAAQCSALSLTEISRTLYGLLDWKRSNAKLKNHECRLLLECLRDQGQMSLPVAQPFGGGRGGPALPHGAIRSRRSPVQPAKSSLARYDTAMRICCGTRKIWRRNSRTKPRCRLLPSR